MACEESDEPHILISGNYPLKQYALERDPKVNVWGAGMDFIHDETALDDTDLDYEYLTEDDDFPYDITFKIVKVYYKDNKGDTHSEGCPAMLLGNGVTACCVGYGVDFFTDFDTLTNEQSNLISEPEVDYEQCKNNDGLYDRDLLDATLESCVIGQRFRASVLEIPEDKTEQEIQPVFLIRTSEGGLVKFMVKQFKGDKPNDKQTIVMWQVISTSAE